MLDKSYQIGWALMAMMVCFSRESAPAEMTIFIRAVKWCTTASPAICFLRKGVPSTIGISGPRVVMMHVVSVRIKRSDYDEWFIWSGAAGCQS